ncbi:MAG: guanylate kinase [Lachnospiraceae bacterium]|nr:guanylate kinase [Lachnospiraceae bacterium]
MGTVFYIMGKSSSGKDTIYRRLLAQMPQLKRVVLYTTRPIRSGEEDGKDYFFVDEDRYLEMKKDGAIIEERAYNTVHGIWRYFTADDGQLEDIGGDSKYLMVGTIDSYLAMKEHFGPGYLVPLYIELDDGERLARALKREREQENPKYRELCRRYLADSEDFSEERLRLAGITKRFCNEDLEHCLKLCMGEIDGYKGKPDKPDK